MTAIKDTRPFRWTARVTWPSVPYSTELVDSRAITLDEARADVLAQLKRDYNPGAVIVEISRYSTGIFVGGW